MAMLVTLSSYPHSDQRTPYIPREFILVLARGEFQVSPHLIDLDRHPSHLFGQALFSSGQIWQSQRSPPYRPRIEWRPQEGLSTPVVSQ